MHKFNSKINMNLHQILVMNTHAKNMLTLDCLIQKDLAGPYLSKVSEATCGGFLWRKICFNMRSQYMQKMEIINKVVHNSTRSKFKLVPLKFWSIEILADHPSPGIW